MTAPQGAVSFSAFNNINANTGDALMAQTHDTATLIETLQSLHRVPRFLMDTFFPQVVTFSTKEIMFDVLSDNLALAPFVSPFVAGKAKKQRGYSTKMFTPAYVKPKTQVDPYVPIARQPGEPPLGSLSPAQRRDLAVNQILIDQREQIDRRIEWMVAELLKTGKIIVTGEDYPETQVDFGRDAALTKILANGSKWGDNGISPYSNLDAWFDLVGEKSGAAVNVAVMGKDAWRLFIADPLTEKALDRQKGQTATLDLGIKPGAPGAPVYKGTIGDVEYFTYNEVYSDAAGQPQKMIDSTGVILGATGALAGKRAFGAIMDGSVLQEAEYAPTHWVENDPPVEQVMTQSAPLPVPGRPNATMYVKVK